MNISEKTKLLLNQLKESFELLDKAVITLEYSFNKSQNIGLKEEYTLDELEVFESLTARFARTSDIYTQMVLKTLFILLQETPQTFIDKANFLEKIGIVKNSDHLTEIRALRNEITHEYKQNELNNLFNEIFKTIPNLLELINNTKTYIEHKFFEKF